jgi:pimeloyl-ACP methyl ester carboxylesterase
VPTTRNGAVELYYETFGSDVDSTLLLVSGLGAQCISYEAEWCERFAAQRFRVVRFDNRDAGLSTKLDRQDYLLWDMAVDAAAVLDAVGADRAHVLGVSMGGMIVQCLAIARPERVRTMTSVMSYTGEPGYGRATPEARALLRRPPPSSREEFIARKVEEVALWGSKPGWVDEAEVSAQAGAAYDRCFCPDGQLRQLHAIEQSGSRGDLLPTLQVPTLVMHGSRDNLVDKSGGQRTAELVPGARYVEIDGMGHDRPRVVWDRWIDEWLALVRA